MEEKQSLNAGKLWMLKEQPNLKEQDDALFNNPFTLTS